MALVLNSQPSGTINLIGNPVLFNFTMTDIESGSEIRRMGYQLLDEDDNELSALESCSPSEGQSFVLNFQDDIRPFIFTEVPALYEAGSPIFREEPSMLIKVKLKYWEIVYNKETCKSEITNEHTTSLYPILNSTEQYYGYSSSNDLGGIVLTLKPKVIESHSSDLVYFWTNGSSHFDLTFFVKDGLNIVELGTSTIALESGVYSFHTTINYDYPQIYKIVVSINDIEICEYYYDECCESELLYFQQSGGGYSTMELELESKEVDSSFSEIFRYQHKDSTYEGPYATGILQRGGNMIHNKVSNKVINFTKRISITSDDELRYYEDFLSSGSYYYKFTSIQGPLNTSPNLVKFIVSSGSLKYYEKENVIILSISGRINQSHQRINNHV